MMKLPYCQNIYNIKITIETKNFTPYRLSFRRVCLYSGRALARFNCMERPTFITKFDSEEGKKCDSDDDKLKSNSGDGWSNFNLKRDL